MNECGRGGEDVWSVFHRQPFAHTLRHKQPQREEFISYTCYRSCSAVCVGDYYDLIKDLMAKLCGDVSERRKCSRGDDAVFWEDLWIQIKPYLCYDSEVRPLIWFLPKILRTVTNRAISVSMILCVCVSLRSEYRAPSPSVINYHRPDIIQHVESENASSCYFWDRKQIWRTIRSAVIHVCDYRTTNFGEWMQRVWGKMLDLIRFLTYHS